MKKFDDYKNPIDYVFLRNRYWFLSSEEVGLRPDDVTLVKSLTESFITGRNAFWKYSDANIQAGLMFLVSADGITELIIGNMMDINLREAYIRSHITMFREVVIPRSLEPISPLNEVCHFYFDSFFEYSCFNPAEIEHNEIFPALGETMRALYGLYSALDQGIFRALSRWLPHLIEKWNINEPTSQS